MKLLRTVLLVTMVSMLGTMSASVTFIAIGRFLTLARSNSQVTVKELVEAYDRVHPTHKDNADKALEVFRNTTIDKLRRELAKATQGSQGTPQLADEDEDEDWGI